MYIYIYNFLYFFFACSLNLSLLFLNILLLYLISVFVSFTISSSIAQKKKKKMKNVDCYKFFVHVKDYVKKKFITILFFHLNEIFHYIYCIIFAHVPQMKSIITSSNRNKSNIIKIHSFFGLNHDNHCNDMVHISNLCLKNTNNDNYHILWIYLFC